MLKRRRFSRAAVEEPMKTIGKHLEDNISFIQGVFSHDNTLTVRRFENEHTPDIRGCVLHLDGMVDKERIVEDILKPVIQNDSLERKGEMVNSICQRVFTLSEVRKENQMTTLIADLMTGHTVLILDNAAEALVINTRGAESRSVTEPESEKILRGPREGFTEPLVVNLSLIRKKIATPNLKFYFMEIGVQSKTKVCICYIEGIANDAILEELKTRLSKIDIDGVIASGYLVELIKDSPYSPLKTIGSTERPDIVAAKLLEGRIAIIVDGTPVALTLPFVFIEHFQANEDYYINYYFSSVSRLLRIFGFLITVSVPGLYVALITFHQEMIPTPLLLSISAARQGVPSPTIVETLLLLLAFEIMRETGIRMPTNIGQALSIVGALVLGQAAVDARIVSAPVVIVVALTGITGLMIPKLKGAIILIRFFLLFISAFMGFYGFIFGVTGLLLHLCSIRSFGVPYMLELTSLSLEDLKDTAVKAPLWFMKKRPAFISGWNKIRQQPQRGRRT